jgi:microcystin-dependent protein
VAETTTVNFNWKMPDPGGSANTWGATLNATTQAIDAHVFANQQAANAGQAPVGSVTMFGGPTPPTGWLLCNGQTLAQTGAYAALFAIIGTAFNVGAVAAGNFMLPNLQGVFPLGAQATNVLGSAGGSYFNTIAVGNLPLHAHPITDVAHTHTATQPAHTHTDAGHSHGVTDNQHQHGSNLVKQGAGTAGLYAGGPFTIAGAGNTDPAPTGIQINAGAANIQAAQPAITVTSSGTGLSTTQAVGGGAAMTIVPKFVALNFIIRYA